jgi:putative N6-adenine-specific DNA methylase
VTFSPPSEIFLVAPPGLETVLCVEAAALGFANTRAVTGGVIVAGGWREVWRANLEVRGAARVLARIGSFRVSHLAQLDKRARQFPWSQFLRKDVPVSVEASCTKSRIYHSGAAAQRIATAIREELGAPIADDAALLVKVRIENDLCTLSIDTSGDALHRRGYKAEVAKAPMRENMAALFLRQCGYDGHEPVLDPMCGSGTFVIEAAEIAMGLKPGRSRRFSFELLASFNAKAWEKMKNQARPAAASLRFSGSDRDQGAIRMAEANARRADVSTVTAFERKAISEIAPPDGLPGLVIINPPYGTRVGERKALHGLYGAMGKVLREKFADWRVGLITTQASLVEATGLPFLPPSEPVLHGGLRIRLYQTKPLP